MPSLPTPVPSRTVYAPESTPLRPFYTHGTPSGTFHTNSLLLPSNSTATHFQPHLPPTPLTTPLSEDLEDNLSALSQSPNGALAALAHRSGRVHIIDIPSTITLRSFRPFNDTAVVSFLAFDASSTFLATASADGHIRIYDTRDAQLTHIFRLSRSIITAIAWHPSPQAMALFLGLESGAIMLCDLSKKQTHPNQISTNHVGAVLAFAFADAGHVIVSAGADRLLCFARWRQTDQVKIVACGERLAGLLTPTGMHARFVVSVGESGTLRRWDVSSAREILQHALKLPFVTTNNGSDGAHDDDEDDDHDDRQTPVLPVALTPCGPDQLVVALSDQTLLYASLSSEGILSPVHDVVCGNLEEVYDLRPLRTRDVSAKVSNKGMRDFALATNSSCLWIMRMMPVHLTNQASPTAKLTHGDVAELNATKENKIQQAIWSCHAGLQGHTGIILCTDALTSPKAVGKANVSDAYVTTSSRDKTARVWRRSRASGKWTCMALAEGHTDAVGAVAISPRTTAGQFFIVTGAADRTIKLWSLDQAQSAVEKKERSQAADKEVRNADEQNWSVRMESDGERDVSTLHAKWTMLAHDKDVNTLAISPDAKLVATGSQDRTLKLWDAGKGTLKFTCKGHKRGIWNAAFSTVDRIVASCSGDATVRLWSVANGSCLRTFQGHLSGVLRSVFISGGTQLASTGADGLIKLWTTKTGECVSTLDAHTDRAWALASMNDGDTVVSGGADGLVQLWRDTTSEQELAAVMRKEEEALLEQQVQNSARAGKWSQAARGALKLGMREKLRGVLMELVQKAEHPSEQLELMVRELSEQGTDENSGWELVTRLFLCCRDWNAVGGTRNAATAMRTLRALFSVFGPDLLCEKLAGVDKRALVEALDAHCGRHLERVNGLVARVSLLEHTLEKMKGLAEIEDIKKQNRKEKRSRARSEELRRDKATVIKRRRKDRSEVAADY